MIAINVIPRCIPFLFRCYLSVDEFFSGMPDSPETSKLGFYLNIKGDNTPYRVRSHALLVIRRLGMQLLVFSLT